MTHPKASTEFVAFLAKRGADLSTYTIAANAERLMAIARRMQAIAERDCNGYPDYASAQQKNDERAWERLRTEAQGIALGFGLGLHVQGDPRGYVLKLLRDGETASAGTGLGVPA